MAKYKPQHSRLLFIDRKIREGRHPNCSSMAEEWEVSRKTIQRDLDYMRYQLDAPVEYSAKQRGYFYTEEQYKLPAMNIRESDLFGVYLAEKLLVQYEGTPIYDSLCSVFEKIEQSLPNKISTDPAGDQSKFTVFPPFSTTIDPAVWKTVIDCLRSSQQVKIQYKTPEKDPVARTIDPYHGVRFEGDWYVVGFCHLRDEIRTFSLSRIITAEKKGNVFQIPEDFDFQKLSGSHFGVHWSDREINVKIRFNKRVADYVSERTWHPSQEIVKCKDGNVILSLTVNHLLELKRWILSWGCDAQVLEPDSFARDIRRTLENTVCLYASK
ncbi:MAG: WYL domain-containing protein [Thermodesulfobacteriota bacterium]|nr:WYL domain-containing protein [Thermodesulfobacteriota bacterium]